ncbi:hypothetical protein CapIbe_000905 [Capra ibex]
MALHKAEEKDLKGVGEPKGRSGHWVTDWIRTAQKRHSNLCFFHLQAFLTGDVHFCEIQGHGRHPLGFLKHSHSRC